ncbi:hypothetical protein C8A00DRAFT_17940 [Chaetomidium leptoderma]|uniref:Uncharacterized protein n=1 Tax=Chaetomidium leptoderma TaxID=669021 RepID=A0AAN6VFX8_9PEZI|nr:hypothetical protein C8A00DRAFT_17940 [Chaetomidium leptoderma]
MLSDSKSLGLPRAPSAARSSTVRTRVEPTEPGPWWCRGRNLFLWLADRHIHTPRWWDKSTCEGLFLLLSSPRAFDIRSIGTGSWLVGGWFQFFKSLTSTLFFLFLPKTSPARNSSLSWEDQRRHVLTNGCWRTVSFWLNCPNRRPASPSLFPSHDTTQTGGGEILHKIHRKPASLRFGPCQGFIRSTRGKDLIVPRGQDAVVFETGRPTNTRRAPKLWHRLC